MAKATDKSAAGNGRQKKPAISKLGRDLLRLRKKIEESGMKMLTTRRELEREIADRRGGGY